MSHRVVITGVGCVTPLGASIDTMWRNLVEGCSGIGPITAFDASNYPVRIAAQVRDWDISAAGQDPLDWARHPRQTHFAVAAALQAAESAGLRDAHFDPRRLGVYLGCGETSSDLAELAEVWPHAVSGGSMSETALLRAAVARLDARQALCQETSTAPQALAALFDAQGPNANCIAACVSATQAVGMAADIIGRGEADVMLAGGAHSMIHPLGITGLLRLSVLSLSNERGPAAMRPFDLQRDGFVVGEGGAVVVLESLQHAVRRGAEIWGELTGYASAHDAYNLTDLEPDGQAAAQCMRAVLQQAGLNVDDVGYINAHGTSTPLNDRVETLAFKRAFGADAYRIPISSTKSMLGHATTACGAIELLVALMVVRTGVIPPTINYEFPDPACDLDYVPNTARRHPCRHVLSDNLGFGGQVAAPLVSRFDEATGGAF